MQAKRTRQRTRAYSRLKTFQIDGAVLMAEGLRAQSKFAEAMLREKWGCHVHFAASYKHAAGNPYRAKENGRNILIM